MQIWQQKNETNNHRKKTVNRNKKQTSEILVQIENI